MPQFDLYRNPNPESCARAPFIVDLQHDMFAALATRVMAPLVAIRPSGEPAMQRLNPVVVMGGQEYFLSTSEMASVPLSQVGKPIDNLSPYRSDLIAAIDLLFTAI